MSKVRAKMPPSQRAKQFAPFDALTGLRSALKEKEKIRVPKKELSEDMAEEIDRVLRNLHPEDIVTLTYYNKLEEQYFQLTGKLKKIDTQNQRLLFDNISIDFDDIYSMI